MVTSFDEVPMAALDMFKISKDVAWKFIDPLATGIIVALLANDIIMPLIN
jgi:hypothetical protein